MVKATFTNKQKCTPCRKKKQNVCLFLDLKAFTTIDDEYFELTLNR